MAYSQAYSSVTKDVFYIRHSRLSLNLFYSVSNWLLTLLFGLDRLRHEV